jgi:hypothetical protein
MVAGKTKKIDGFQQIRLPTPVEPGYTGYPTGKAVIHLGIVPELIQ